MDKTINRLVESIEHATAIIDANPASPYEFEDMLPDVVPVAERIEFGLQRA